jgi:hypothetical protein
MKNALILLLFFLCFGLMAQDKLSFQTSDGTSVSFTASSEKFMIRISPEEQSVLNTLQAIDFQILTDRYAIVKMEKGLQTSSQNLQRIQTALNNEQPEQGF